MEIVAHGLWAAAAAVATNRCKLANPRIAWTVWWAAFPEVLAFGPSFAVGLWLRLSGALESGTAHGGQLPHVHLGLPLYPMGHTFLAFLLVFVIAAILARRVVVELLGWLLHILIDIPTHSFSYYATRFLWPLSDFRIDGIAWWTPWFWISTYAALAAVYFLMWRKGWLWQKSAAASMLGSTRINLLPNPTPSTKEARAARPACPKS
jgi:hypothetical protein